MLLAKVVGNAVSHNKNENLLGLKLLIVLTLGNAKGEYKVAIDTLGYSGIGDIVYLAKSNESTLPLKVTKKLIPSDLGILGIVDNY